MLGQTLKRYFIAGLLALLPIAITLYIAYRLFRFFDGLLGGVIRDLTGHYIPGLGLVAVFVLITGIGALVSNILGGYALGVVDAVFSRVPVLKSVYEASKQLLSTVLERRGGGLRTVVLVPFPHEGMLTLGFLVAERVPGDPPRSAVFVPFSPPTAGHVVLVPCDRVVRTELSTEQAMRLLLSGGLGVGVEDLGGVAAPEVPARR
jgi:uncharacterized membrane protein